MERKPLIIFVFPLPVPKFQKELNKCLQGGSPELCNSFQTNVNCYKYMILTMVASYVIYFICNFIVYLIMVIKMRNTFLKSNGLTKMSPLPVPFAFWKTLVMLQVYVLLRWLGLWHLCQHGDLTQICMELNFINKLYFV